MLNELFTYAKLQDANYEIELSELDVTSLTAEIMVSFYDDIAGKGEEPEIHLPEEPVFIKGNREAYTRVVQNIIKNALVHGKNLCITLKSEAAGTIFECRDELMDPETEVDTTRIFDRLQGRQSQDKCEGQWTGSCHNQRACGTNGRTGIGGMRKRDIQYPHSTALRRMPQKDL